MSCGRRVLGLAALWALGGKEVERSSSKATVHDSTTHCPECGWEVSTGFAWCPQCGYRLTPYHCDYCQSVVPQSKTECPHCGASLLQLS